MAEGVPGEPDPVASLSAAVTHLRAERDGLLRAMRHRGVIEQAKGVLVERLGLSPDDAFTHLAELSSRTNTKVAEVAASLVAMRAPTPDAPGTEPSPLAELQRSATTPVSPAPTATPVPRDDEGLRAQHQLLAARIAAARSIDEIAAALASGSTAWPRPSVVMLLLLDADGAHRLGGAAGLSVEERLQWGRLPPIPELPVTIATRQRTPILVSDVEDAAATTPLTIGMPQRCRAFLALPLLVEDRAIGAAWLSWEAPLTLEEGVAPYLRALALPIAERCSGLGVIEPETPARDEDVIDPSALPLLLQALHRPAVLLAPIRGGDEQIIDFRVEHASDTAQNLIRHEGIESSETTLLSALPHVGSLALVPLFTEVLHSGLARDIPDLRIDAAREGTRAPHVIEVHAARLWDRVLVTWRARSEAELLGPQLCFAEEAFGLGSFQWDVAHDEVRWSPGLYRLLGRPRNAGPLDGRQARALFDAHDLARLLESAREALDAEKPISAELRGAGPLEGRRVRVVAGAERNADGAVLAIYGACRDVTALSKAAENLQRAQSALADEPLETPMFTTPPMGHRELDENA
jgi:PAS domain-containing protein